MSDTCAPIFGSCGEPDPFWSRLDALNQRTDGVSSFRDDTFIMTVHLRSFVDLHEIHHVHFGHAPLLRAVGGRHDPRAGLLNSDEAWNLFIRLPDGITMLFGLTDSHRKHVHGFAQGANPHPIIRHAIAARAMAEFLAPPGSLRPIGDRPTSRAGNAACGPIPISR